MRRSFRINSWGFTLIELLVVISIIGILGALLVVALQFGREASRKAGCVSKLRQIGIAMESYRSQHSVFPPGTVWTPQHAGFGWAAKLLPNLEQNDLYEQLSFRHAIDSPWNQTIVGRSVDAFLCPSDHQAATAMSFGFAQGSYVGSAGSVSGNGILFPNSAIGVQEIRDGLSHTLLVSERGSDGEIQATWSGDPDSNGGLVLFWASKSPKAGEGLRGGTSSYHSNGAQALFADGSATILSLDINHSLYEALATRRGKEMTAGATEP